MEIFKIKSNKIIAKIVKGFVGTALFRLVSKVLSFRKLRVSLTGIP